MQDIAEPIPIVEYKGFTELPLYSRHSSFSEKLNLSEPTTGSTDPWPWLPSRAKVEDNGCEWCHNEGKNDRHSLKIHHDANDDAQSVSEWV